MTSMTGTNFYMKNKWEVDLRIRKKLEGSFFCSLIDMIPYVQKTTFQQFIQSCYDKDSRTFTFGRDSKVELYFGLEDVFALSGFPVDGRPVVCDDIDAKQLCQDMLGTYEEECPMKMKVSQKWLKTKFEVVPENISEHDIEHYVRGYLIYLIGSKVLPNCDKTTYYPVYWLQFLEDLSPSALNDVAWGAAAHAMLHTCLSSRKRKNVKGPMWILELFFMERFPKIANLYMGVNKTIGSSELKVKEVPLFDYWCPFMVHPGKVTGKPQPEEFDSIRKDVNWVPYLDYLRYLRQKIFFSRAVLFCFDQIIYHEPEKGFHQLEIVNLQPVERLETLVVKSSKGCQQRNLMASYRPYIQMWENRHLDSNCIRDARSTFSLPSAPAQNDSETNQHGNDTNDYELNDDFVGPVNDFMPKDDSQTNKLGIDSNDTKRMLKTIFPDNQTIVVRDNSDDASVPETPPSSNSSLNGASSGFSLTPEMEKGLEDAFADLVQDNMLCLKEVAEAECYLFTSRLASKIFLQEKNMEKRCAMIKHVKEKEKKKRRT